MLWARLFDVRYQLLLLDLWLGTMTDRTVTGAFSRDNLINAALSEMTDRISPLAGKMLPTMDLKDVGSGDREAGAPFGLPQKRPYPQPKDNKKRMGQLSAIPGPERSDHATGRTNAPTTDESDFLDAMLASDNAFSNSGQTTCLRL